MCKYIYTIYASPTVFIYDDYKTQTHTHTHTLSVSSDYSDH